MKRKQPSRQKDALKKKSDFMRNRKKHMKLNPLTSRIRINQKNNLIMNAIDLNEARVYVGTYAKYNNYSNYGKWFELSEFSNKDEFIRACAEFHNDDDDPEFMFQAWTNIPEDLICESWLSDKFFDIKDTLNDLSPDEQEPFLIWCNNGTHNLHTNDINELIASFRDDFQGKYKDEEDYAYSIIEECYNLPQLALDYFDYEKFAYDLFLGDCWFENGFVFRIS